MSIVHHLITSPWFWLDVLLSISGGIIVWKGLLIEKRAEKMLPPEDFGKDIFGDIVRKYKKEVERGWRILMIGIIVEVVAALGISIISGLESAVLNAKAEQAEKEAAQANERAVITESNIVVLSKATVELAHIYDLSTNALAEANERLKSAEPPKERLIDLLKEINPSWLQILKGGKTVHFRGPLPQYIVGELQSFQTNPETSQFLKLTVQNGMVITTNFGGIEAEVDLYIDPALMQ